MKHAASHLVAAVIASALALTASLPGSADTGPAPRSISVATSEPVTLNPGRQTIAFNQTEALFSSLTYVGDDGKVSYRNAESVTGDDAIHWTIKLRSGWTFHNGEPVTAQSYVNAWNTVAYGPNGWENSWQLANIAGYDDLNPASGEPQATAMSGLEVVDDLTFTVDLKSADGQFPVQLSQLQTGFFPLPKAAYDDFDAFGRNPIGNGAFMMAAPYKENEPITVNAYPGYAGERPTVDQIVFKPYTDMTTAYTDVQAGNTDIVYVPASRMAQVKQDFGDRAYIFRGLGMNYLGLPLWDERYADIRIRQAISMAIDRQAISDALYGGIWEPASALTPPGEPGTPVGLCGELCTYNPEKARRLLAEAGGWKGAMEIVYPGGSGLDDLYSAYANQLRQNLGIETIIATPTTDFPEFFSKRTNKELNGPYFSRWGALYPSQQNTLRSFYTKAGGCVNCIPYYTEEVERLIAAADAEVDPQKAIEGYVRVQEVIMKDFPAPPMFFEKYTYATSEKIKSLTPTAGAIDLSRTLVVDQ